MTVLALGLASAASAATACSSGGQGGPANFQILTGTLSQNTTLSSGFSCSIGAFTFSNFSVFGTVINEGAGLSFTLTESATASGISFGFNNLGTDDIALRFQLSPGVTGDTLTAGLGTSVSEGVCSVQPDTAGGCSGTVLSLNPNWFATNGGSSFSTITIAANDFFFKDIRGGSGLTQTFTPEPVTFSLMGLGLLGIGLVGRKLHKK
jgi:hypothetical protein